MHTYIIMGRRTPVGKKFFKQNPGPTNLVLPNFLSDDIIDYMKHDEEVCAMAAKKAKEAINKMFKEVRPEIKDVIFNPPATIVFWDDGTKTVVKAKPGVEFDPYIGLSMACAKKLIGHDFGNKFVELVDEKYRTRWFTVDIYTPLGKRITSLTPKAHSEEDALSQARTWVKQKSGNPNEDAKYIFKVHEDKPEVKMLRWHVEAKEEKGSYSSTLAFEVNATNADNAEANARSFIDIIKKRNGANLNYKITTTILGEVVTNE